jgi:hypothetical protein
MRSRFDVEAHLAMWQKAVDVQMHFNDIGWRIRALGLTVLTFTFGAIGYMYAQSEGIDFLGRLVTPAFIVPVVGAFLWVAFWFTDAGWYHKLLVGSVRDAMRLERLLSQNGVAAELGSLIAAESPIKFYRVPTPAELAADTDLKKVARQFRGKDMEIHSKHKLNIFYGGITGLLIVSAIALFLFVAPPKAKATDPPVVNNISVESPEVIPAPLPTSTPLPTATPTL